MTLQAWKLPQLILKNRPTFRGLVHFIRLTQDKAIIPTDKLLITD